jgi:hypothetical protein
VRLLLSIWGGFAQNHAMADNTDPTTSLKGLVQWALTPPQAYVVYVIGLLLVFSVSFFAGTLQPKKPVETTPPPVSVPKN